MAAGGRLDGEPGLIEFWKQKSRQIKFQTYALYFAYRDPRTPWFAKGFIALVVAYAFSPIDLIPDFIPVLGYLDDFILIPLGVMLAIRMIPREVKVDSEERARRAMDEEKPQFKFMGAVIIGIWVVIAVLIIFWVVNKILKGGVD
jgi:uncharacterized membrane protein YkvA (DUF1232 family)